MIRPQSIRHFIPYLFLPASKRSVFPSVLLALLVLPLSSPAQEGHPAGDIGSCTLKNHIYTCNRADFERAFATARNISIETQSVDALSRTKLGEMLTTKYGKTVVANGSPADLIFLIIPLGQEGVSISPGEVPLGTLRVYSATPEGGRGHLVWAETYSGEPDLPWPAISRALLLQFQSHFHPG